MNVVKKPERAFAFAYKLEDGSLCWWAEPHRKDLVNNGKPSPGAKIVRVELVEVKRKKRRK